MLTSSTKVSVILYFKLCLTLSRNMNSTVSYSALPWKLLKWLLRLCLVSLMQNVTKLQWNISNRLSKWFSNALKPLRTNSPWKVKKLSNLKWCRKQSPFRLLLKAFVLPWTCFPIVVRSWLLQRPLAVSEHMLEVFSIPWLHCIPRFYRSTTAHHVPRWSTLVYSSNPNSSGLAIGRSKCTERQLNASCKTFWST